LGLGGESFLREREGKVLSFRGNFRGKYSYLRNPPKPPFFKGGLFIDYRKPLWRKGRSGEGEYRIRLDGEWWSPNRELAMLKAGGAALSRARAMRWRSRASPENGVSKLEIGNEQKAE
jgi:hypothetical protein